MVSIFNQNVIFFGFVYVALTIHENYNCNKYCHPDVKRENAETFIFRFVVLKLLNVTKLKMNL